MSTTSPQTTGSFRGGHFTGTGHLLRLSLRRDRIRLPVWTLVFLILVYASVAAMEVAYPDQESLQARAMLLNNPAAIMMTGPLFGVDNYTFGAMVANELALWTFLPAGIMGVLFMTRHTRAEEESGRLEMLRALPVGRFAAPAAASLLVLIAAVLVGAAVSVALLIAGLAVPDSLAFGVATTLITLTFAALAAVAAQLTESSRAATGLGLAALILAAVVRGIGDVINMQGSWVSWLSPIAWAQQTRLYTDLRWWPLLLLAAAVVVLGAVAFTLAARRDLGGGLLPPRPGPAEATPRLLSPAGLALRLETAMFLWWTLGLFLFAVAFGSLASEVEGMVSEMPTVTEYVDINLDDLTLSFASVQLAMLTIGPVALITSGILRLRSEESDGRLAAVLQSGSSRPSLLGRWSLVIGAEAVVMQVLLGFGLGSGIAIATAETSWITDMTLGSLAYLPALLLYGAMAAALFGLLPRLAGLAWLLVGWSALVLFLGEILNLPDWARGLSPMWHVPNVPEPELTGTPLVVLGVLTVLLAVAGLVGFRRRDITVG